MSARGRIIKIGLAFVIGCVLAVGVAAAVLFKPWVRDRVIAEAKERGLHLDPGPIGIGWFTVTVGRSTFAPIGISGVRGSSETTVVSFDGLEPARIEATGVDIQVRGSAAILALEVSEWTKRYPNAYKVPTRATKVSVTWRSSQHEKPWVTIKGGTLEPSGGGSSFRAEDTQVLGASLGKVGAAWSSDEAVVALGFGEGDVTNSPVRIQVKHTLEQPTADITLVPVKLKQLAGPFGVALPVKDDVVASGKVNLVFKKGMQSGVVEGTFSAKLEGYVPPHPPELSGFVFGDETTFSTKLSVSEDRMKATLTDSVVKAGAFKLKGSGNIQRFETHARIRMKLLGNLPCDALASAAAESYLGKTFGKTLGRLAGAAAKSALGGSVGVTVKLDADTRKLPEAKVDRIIGIGCGLKPLDLGDLSKLPALAKEFPELLKELPPPPKGMPKLPGGLPALPSGLPPLPKIDIGTKPPEKPKPKPSGTAKPKSTAAPKPKPPSGPVPKST